MLIFPRRILHISNHKDTVEINSPPGGVVNIAVAEPSKLTEIGGYVCAVEHHSFIISTLMGVCTYFDNEKGSIRQICIKPFFHSWPRFIAVIGSILGSERLRFRTWRNGVVFGTGIYDSHGRKVFHKKGKVCTLIDGAMLPPSENSQFVHLGSLNCVY